MDAEYSLSEKDLEAIEEQIARIWFTTRLYDWLLKDDDRGAMRMTRTISLRTFTTTRAEIYEGYLFKF